MMFGCVAPGARKGKQAARRRMVRVKRVIWLTRE
jgi:hypothetical protein